MWQHFSTVNVGLSEVGKVIGGKVQQNIEIGLKDTQHHGFENACAIRMSYSLHHSGITIIPGHPTWETVSGADKKLYIYRVADLRKFLETTFGKPDKAVSNPFPRDFSGMKGILVFTQHFVGASGHATLWNGITCSDHCYFPRSTKAEIWLLK
jgi:hypothetical protein